VVAHGSWHTDAVAVANTVTRPAAFEMVHSIASNAIENGLRVLVGFDFAYGYRPGTAHELGLADPDGGWRAVWRLRRELADDDAVGVTDVNNTVNRFAMANEINQRKPVCKGWPRFSNRTCREKAKSH